MAAMEKPFPAPRERSSTDDSAPRSLEERIQFKRSDQLRGTRVTDVLRGFSRVFANREGSAESFELSSPVEGIEYFISHNWSTPRWDKFLALAVYFNRRTAVAAMWVAALLTVPLTVLGVLPMLEFVPTQGAATVVRESVSSHIIGVSVLMLTLAFGHELRAVLRCKDPITFVDKTCIPQMDAEQKREGIESLAAFLEHSEKMIVIYSSTYLKKLWTVYELSSLLLLHPERKIIVIPCFFPKVVLSGFVCWTLFQTLHRVLLLRPVVEAATSFPGLGNATLMFTLVVLVLMALLLQMILEKWARDCNDIKEVIQNFSIRNAECFHESDRIVVQGNMASFMRGLGIVVASKAEDEEAFQRRALDSFDDLVRTKVPPAMAACLGRQTISYGQAVFMFSCQCLRGLEQLAPCILGETPPRRALLLLTENLTVGMAFLPLVVAMLLFTALRNAASKKRSPTWRRLRSLVQFVGIWVMAFVTWSALNVTSKRAVEDDVWLAIYALFVSAHVVLVALVYRPMRHEMGPHAREQRISEVETATESWSSSSVMSI